MLAPLRHHLVALGMDAFDLPLLALVTAEHPPDLRIVPDDLWRAVKDRQGDFVPVRGGAIANGERRPKSLFWRLLKCGGCALRPSSASSFLLRNCGTPVRPFCLDLRTAHAVEKRLNEPGKIAGDFPELRLFAVPAPRSERPAIVPGRLG